MTNTNYYVVQGWMINEMKLKGNPLLVFAIIYGFSQDGSSKYTGSLKYLQSSTNASKNTVMNSLTDLEEKGFIIKYSMIKNNIKFNEYSHNDPVVQKMIHPRSEKEQPGSESEQPDGSEIAPVGGAKSGHNTSNINNKPLDNKEEKGSFDLFGQNEIIIPTLPKDILKILNEKKPSKIDFKFTDSNLDPIKARIKEGFKKEEFIRVIDHKIKEWKDDLKMKKYIRPETLFGTKMNKYLVESGDSTIQGNNDGSSNFEYKPQKKASLA